MLDLGHIWFVRLLVLANIGFHNIADIGKALMSILSGLHDFKHLLVILGNLSLKLYTDGASTTLTVLDESLEIRLIGHKLGSQLNIALICKLVDVITKSLLHIVLISDLLSQLVILIITLINEIINLILKLNRSVFKLTQLLLLHFDLFIFKFGNELERFFLFFEANDVSFEIGGLLDQDVDVTLLLREFIHKVGCQAWYLSFEVF